MNPTSSEIDLRRRVLLCLQTSLLGMVGPNLRGVTAGWTPTRISVRMYFDGEVTEAELDTASDVEGEMIASFPGVEVTVEALSAPMPVRPPILSAWAYLRRE